MLLAIQVIVCVVLVVIVGIRLSRSADVLAEKSGLGRTWVGAILLAGATSLPELATGTSAVVALNAPDLAAGGIFGSCLFNLLILVFIESISGRDSFFQSAPISHALAAGLSCILLGIAAGGLLLAGDGSDLALGWIGLPSLLMIWLYIVSTRMIARFELRRHSENAQQTMDVYQYQHITRTQAYLTFAVLAAAIVLLGVWLAALGDRVAAVTGLGESFIGALLLAAATSLPEVIASLEAVRLRAIDLAISNIFGSNIFNLVILAIYDLVYVRGDLWFTINQAYTFTAVIGMLMTTVAIVGLIYREAKRTPLYVSWNSLALVALYLVGMYILYRG